MSEANTKKKTSLSLNKSVLSMTKNNQAKAKYDTVPVTRVVITGATTDIAQKIAYLVAQGKACPEQKPGEPELLKLQMILVDPKRKHRLLTAQVAELSSCLLPWVKQWEISANLTEALKGADLVFLCGGVVPDPNFTRNDFVSMNSWEYKRVGEALEEAGVKPTAKILVVSNPPNVLMKVIQHYAPSVKRENLMGLSRHDQNRAATYIARFLDIAVDKVQGLTVWGNRSDNIFVDLIHSEVQVGGRKVSSLEAIKDDHFIKHQLSVRVNKRQQQIEKLRKTAMCLPVASAACQHMCEWWGGTGSQHGTSMVVFSDGSYGVPEGQPFSFPVLVAEGGVSWKIVNDINLSSFVRERLEEQVVAVEKEINFAWVNLKLEVTSQKEKGGEAEQEAPWSFGQSAKLPCSVLRGLERGASF